MTYDRMKAKPIKGKTCCLCADSSAPLVKMPCCDQWVCCDTSFLSLRGGGRCQFEHEQYSICHFHYNEKHSDSWKQCKECIDFFGIEEHQRAMDTT